MIDFCVNFTLGLLKVLGALLVVDIVIATFVFAPLRMFGILPEHPGWETVGWVLATLGYGVLAVGVLALLYRAFGRE